MCDYWTAINKTLAAKKFRPTYLRDIMLDLVWENRDIQISHLNFFAGARIVPADGGSGVLNGTLFSVTMIRRIGMLKSTVSCSMIRSG